MRSRFLAAATLCASLVTASARAQQADEATIGAHLDTICATALSARLHSFANGLELDDGVGAFTFTRTAVGDYLIVGVPPDMPEDATIAGSLHDGTPLTILGRISRTLAVARAPLNSTRLYGDVGQSPYQNNMAISIALYRSCEDLGGRMNARGILLPEEEDLAVECEKKMTYTGPTDPFFCPRMGGVVSWAFPTMTDVRYVPTENAAVPGAYLGHLRGAVSAARWSEPLGLPVFDPRGAQSIPLGIITEAVPLIQNGKRIPWIWNVVVGPVESVMSRAIDVVYASER